MFFYSRVMAEYNHEANNKLYFPDRESNPGRGGESAES